MTQLCLWLGKDEYVLFYEKDNDVNIFVFSLMFYQPLSIVIRNSRTQTVVFTFRKYLEF